MTELKKAAITEIIDCETMLESQDHYDEKFKFHFVFCCISHAFPLEPSAGKK